MIGREMAEAEPHAARPVAGVHAPSGSGVELDPSRGRGLHEPAGVDCLILLVTRQPFVGFTNTRGELATTPRMMASSAEAW